MLASSGGGPQKRFLNVRQHVEASAQQGGREYMEDRIGVVTSKSSPCCVMGVFDGHGGHQVAEFASQQLPPVLLNSFVNTNDDRMHVFRDAFLDIDRRAMRVANKSGTVGSTACVAVVQRVFESNIKQSTQAKPPPTYTLWVANSGDSRCVLRTARDVVQMSTDHKPGTKSERQRINAHGGFVANVNGVHRVQGNLSLSRALGDWYMRPYVIPHPGISQRVLNPSDRYLLLATDGLWDVFTSKGACDFVDNLLDKEKTSFRQVPKRLVHAAMARGSQDNITVILAMLS